MVLRRWVERGGRGLEVDAGSIILDVAKRGGKVFRQEEAFSEDGLTLCLIVDHFS